MPYFMCPNCKLRRSVVSGAEALGEEPDHTRPPCFNCECDGNDRILQIMLTQKR